MARGNDPNSAGSQFFICADDCGSLDWQYTVFGEVSQGLDTVDANIALGFRDDERDYEVAAHMLASLNVSSIYLMTNNPRKIQELEKLGRNVSGRIPHVIPATEWNRHYLETKARRSGHQIELESTPPLSEQNDPVIIEGQS